MLLAGRPKESMLAAFIETTEVIEGLRLNERGVVQGAVRKLRLKFKPRTGAAVVEFPGGFALTGGLGSEGIIDDITCFTPAWC